jgi:hypothetical protein
MNTKFSLDVANQIYESASLVDHGWTKLISKYEFMQCWYLEKSLPRFRKAVQKIIRDPANPGKKRTKTKSNFVFVDYTWHYKCLRKHGVKVSWKVDMVHETGIHIIRYKDKNIVVSIWGIRNKEFVPVKLRIIPSDYLINNVVSLLDSKEVQLIDTVSFNQILESKVHSEGQLERQSKEPYYHVFEYGT